MRTIKLMLQYDGTNYAGWQVQDNAQTVQELIERALATILQEKIRIAGASRTDSGVHALGQVAAFKTSTRLSSERLLRGLNGVLPPDIRVTDVADTDAGFVPRFAKEKTYRYAIAYNGVLNPFQMRYVWHVRAALDFDAMQTASEFFIGEHDFSSFAAAGGGEKSHVRRVLRIEMAKGGIIDTCLEDDNVFHFDITANGFLYRMVRNMVGTVVEVGRGKIAPEQIPAIIEMRDRTRAGPTAPASGLCLVSVRY